MPQAKFQWPLILEIMCTLNVILSKSSIKGWFHEPTKYANKKEKVDNSMPMKIRDWSLITGREGLQNGRGGGHVKFYTYEKWGRKKF